MKLETRGWYREEWSIDGVDVAKKLTAVAFTVPDSTEKLIVPIQWGMVKEYDRDMGATHEFNCLQAFVVADMGCGVKMKQPLQRFIQDHKLEIVDYAV